MRWQICEVDGNAVARLGRELNIPSIVARLLILRGVTDPETAQRFLHPALEPLHNPFLLADMKAAVDRLRRALEQEKILVYGDYDVDGTMSVITNGTTFGRRRLPRALHQTTGRTSIEHLPNRSTPPIDKEASPEVFRGRTRN